MTDRIHRVATCSNSSDFSLPQLILCLKHIHLLYFYKPPPFQHCTCFGILHLSEHCFIHCVGRIIMGSKTSIKSLWEDQGLFFSLYALMGIFLSPLLSRRSGLSDNNRVSGLSFPLPLPCTNIGCRLDLFHTV
jgi:hypothetical protein